MNGKNGNRLSAVLCFGAVLLLFLLSVIMPDRDISASERRRLAELPELSLSSIASGSFMTEFEDYSVDQFPFRDGFRSLKALSASRIFARRDNNGVYVRNGYISKLEYPLDDDSIENAAEKFRYIYDRYLSDTGSRVYLSVIPDKNLFMAKENGYPSLDYEKLVASLRSGTDFAEYIDIFPLLELEDYYKTDTHWRQEKITDVAQAIASAMGAELSDTEYETRALEKPFYGVYYGQAALPMASETLYYLDSSAISGAVVRNLEEGKTGGVYDLERADGLDPYEVFLSGPRSLMVIENPNAATDRELIVFRDSFGASLAPLLISGYSKITLVDIRYLSSQALGRFIDFSGQDVLFIYSTLVLNNSITFK